MSYFQARAIKTVNGKRKLSRNQNAIKNLVTWLCSVKSRFVFRLPNFGDSESLNDVQKLINFVLFLLPC